MGEKRNLQRIVRGWFPQEPRIRSYTSLQPTKPAWNNTLNAVASLIIVLGVLCAFVVLDTSWIKSYVLLIAIIAGLAYLVAHRRPRVRRIIKNMLVPVMIFTLCFTAVEGYLFWNAGYPTTYSSVEPNVSLSMERMLNGSVSDIVRGIEQSAAFRLLSFEHGDDIVFESMTLNPAIDHYGGYVRVDFNSKKSDTYIQVRSSNGHQYIVQVTPDNRQVRHYAASTENEQSLRQIDNLGLNWFSNHAIEIAENRSSILPTVDSLNIELTFGEGADGYEGIIVQLVGYHITADTDGGINGEGVLIAGFQPDGTLIYMTKPALNIHEPT